MASVQAEFEERPVTLREEEVVMSSCLEESLLDIFTLTIVLVLLWKKKSSKAKHRRQVHSIRKNSLL